ncbi:MAG: DUF2306 domain-containing protein [Hyphomonadaceae bacterium]|nr:DUF2306 domain-containing protein [Hyphomonadaceae bacterium]
MTAIAERSEPPEWTGAALRISAVALVGAVWISSAIFGFYILAYYGGAIPASTLEDWNATLPRLYEGHTPAASAGIGAHFFAGAVLLLLGPVQLIGEIRAKAPVVHRWIGRVYAFAAFAAGVGGLLFIVLKGTVGGMPMTVAFSMYGALMVLAAVQTVRHAMARNIDVHRAWAIRLFALAIGSWLYRMGYGFWFLFAGEMGHTEDFSGWFDYIMDFAFFIPPLIVAEMFIRARRGQASTVGRVATTAAMAGGAAFIALATFFFTMYGWGPAIATRFGA